MSRIQPSGSVSACARSGHSSGGETNAAAAISKSSLSSFNRHSSLTSLSLPLSLCNSLPQIRSSMETAAVLGSFHVPFSRSTSKHPSLSRALVEGQRLIFSKQDKKGSLYSGIKASGTISALKSDVDTSQRISESPSQKKNIRSSTFPNGFETLLLEVCDETDVAELKLKAGDFEMHLKREIGASKASIPIAPPIVSSTIVESASFALPVVPQKTPSVATSPFTNVVSAKASKLSALEASESKSYVLVSSPTVGSFRRGRTLKGKKQPPSCKEGDVIKEGQIIGFLDQFGSELPVRSDAAGEVLKVLYEDGEAVGYGDPLIALLPSFHGIK